MAVDKYPLVYTGIRTHVEGIAYRIEITRLLKVHNIKVNGTRYYRDTHVANLLGYAKLKVVDAEGMRSCCIDDYGIRYVSEHAVYALLEANGRLDTPLGKLVYFNIMNGKGMVILEALEKHEAEQRKAELHRRKVTKEDITNTLTTLIAAVIFFSIIGYILYHIP